MSVGMQTICWKTWPKKTTKLLWTKISTIIMMSPSVHLIFESERPWYLCDLNYVSAISIFVNEEVPSDSCEPTFKFMVRNICLKGRKIKERDAC